MCHLVYGVIKLSILFFYRRIFITPRFRKTTDIFMVIVIAWMITAAFVSKTKIDTVPTLTWLGTHLFYFTCRHMVDRWPQIQNNHRL